MLHNNNDILDLIRRFRIIRARLPRFFGGTVMTENKKVLEFYSLTCRPCKLMMPIVEEVAQKAGLLLEKIEISEAPETADRYGIKSVPTLVLFKGKTEIRRLTGLSSRKEVENFICSE